ncbi:nitrogen fixation protein NifB [Methanohalophilus levihalophilus]|uniref:nitrogenase cofactor biosynthesis protein NifB n=1 Tax=Methanohalophilus levihalophilus TaxID=1431282 RepID=UPI001AE1ED12|nr:nitrogenase cofactor biosynthesis protein NifB [Methanohalophilus levihalophilus]MBP2031010.1 nitrogen fixation protein NifB [Methanohalophilus levihalophilus]
MPEESAKGLEECEEDKFADDIHRKISQHPCYDKSAQHKYGRIHLPVAPKCNIQCNYCERKFDCVNESRPGVTSEVLSPQQALEKTRQVLKDYPFIKVVAVAGPGDPLANDETFETLELIKNEFPDITLCLSTNGLALPERMEDILRVGVETLTVTMNTIDPEIGAHIIGHVSYQGKVYRGIEAASILLKNQLEGIKKAVDAGLVVKINTVMIPGINDDHIVDVAKKLNEMGVYIMNVMPLITQAKFADLTAPTEKERKAVQNACEPYVQQMRHCRQCRSDAYGLIGKDLSQMSEERRNLIKVESLKHEENDSEK